MTAKRWLLAALLVPFAAACSATPRADVSPTPTSGPRAPAPPAHASMTVTISIDDRPFQLHVPASYDPAVKAPLVVLLHGYNANAAIQEDYFKLTTESDRRGFLYAMPDGTTDRIGKRFWNATEACCDLYRSGVDDSAYLHRVLEAVKSLYSVDSLRVYLIGHSNGGFMAYRMACEHALEITAIVSLAGAATDNPSQCAPQRPVSVLEIHGTDDRLVPFGGGTIAGHRFPSVATTLATWRRLNGCADEADTSAAPFDLDSNLPGAETTVTTYATRCLDATRVELWSMRKGSHIPALTADFAPAIIDFLYACVSS